MGNQTNRNPEARAGYVPFTRPIPFCTKLHTPCNPSIPCTFLAHAHFKDVFDWSEIALGILQATTTEARIDKSSPGDGFDGDAYRYN